MVGGEDSRRAGLFCPDSIQLLQKERGRRRDKMKRYRIREGSIADYGRVAIAGIAFWAVIIITALSVYPV